MGSPKKPKKTAEEKALERRQTIALDKEIGETEERMAALTRGTLGRVSLLSGAPKNVSEAISGPRPGGASGAGNLSGSRGSTGGGSGSTGRSLIKGVRPVGSRR
jgi:hypothetical protein